MFGFGGSSSGSSSSSSSSSSNNDSSSSSPFPTISNNPSSSPSSSSGFSSNDSTTIRTRVETALQQQSNLLNAKYLMQKINENCFAHCVPNPGSSLSGNEQGCLSKCMEKYIEGWNVVNRAYITRLSREGANLGGVLGQGSAGAGAAGLSGGDGKSELF